MNSAILASLRSGNDFTEAFSESILYNLSLLSGSIETKTRMISGERCISSSPNNPSKNFVITAPAFPVPILSSGIHLQIISFLDEKRPPHWSASWMLCSVMVSVLYIMQFSFPYFSANHCCRFLSSTSRK